MFKNDYGEFLKYGSEYAIYNKPPRPWCNILANENFGCIMKDDGPDFTWFINSQQFKLTPHSGDYLDDFSPEELVFTKSNISLFENTTCIHGLGYTIYTGKDYTITTFVTGHRKVYIIEQEKEKEIRFNIVPCMGEKENKKFIEKEFKNNCIIYQNNYNLDFAHLEMYITSSEPVIHDNGIVVNAKEFILELGIANKEQSKGLSLVEAKEELEKVKNYWLELLPSFDAGNKEVDIFLNYWFPYQAISSRLWARTGYYQVSGAYGFRDQLQDCINIIDVSSEFLKKQIINSCLHQYVEGDVQHWWHAITDDSFHAHKGVRTKITDDRLWLPLAVAEYIEVTDDKSILDMKLHYIESEPLKDDEHERYELPKISEQSGTVLEHCKKAIEISLKFGEHGLPLIGGGDWNDGLSAVGLEGKGESVWLGWFMIYVIKKFEKYADYSKYLTDLTKACNDAWDSEWFLRGYYDNGNPIGSKTCDECKIDCISQSWAVISGAGDKEKCITALDSAEEYLVDKEEGMIKLLTPPFQHTNNNPGYIKGYIAGVRENGGQYTHAAVWYVWALYLMGNIEKAKEYYKMLLPLNRSETYGLEPYVLAADIYSGVDNEGVGGWSWYTGAAGWMYRIGRILWE